MIFRELSQKETELKSLGRVSSLLIVTQITSLVILSLEISLIGQVSG